ncbi:hypothetical protein ANCDUO_08760 [Ancylostoma duodenale]|uniref:Uncharacterized protein n=1 Tax=Ancylostoma duodenale TaxID=51022 RepID=A0A0C2GIF7_9BILA|nr:hypothetical protein ANCDUO_08760 [Ancylostoma duodenale]
MRNKIFNAPSDVAEQQPMTKETQNLVVSTLPTPNQEVAILITKDHVRTFTKAKRLSAIMLRFLTSLVSKVNAKRKNKIITTSLRSSPRTEVQYDKYINGKEIQWAGQVLVRNHQQALITPNIIKSLKHLSIKKDEQGILRCHGRLGCSELDLATKYPIFILQKTDLAEKIINDYHQHMHPRINRTIAIEDLPKERVVRTRPFQSVGLDYFGPTPIAPGNTDEGKVNGCIITYLHGNSPSSS